MAGSGQDVRAGGAFVELLLKDNKFSSGLSAAKDKLATFAKGAALAGAAVAAAAAAGIATGIGEFVSMGSELDKLSKQTHKSVEDLSELQHAAEDSKVPFENVTKALVMMQKKGLDPNDFDKIAKGIASIKDPVQQTQAAIAVWGKSGATLLPMIGNLQQLREHAREMGFTMSGPAAASAARLRVMLNDLWETVKFGAIAIGQAAAPFLEVALPIIQRFATAGLFAVKRFGDYVASNIGAVTNYVSAAWVAVEDTIGPVLDWMQDAVLGTIGAIDFAFQNWRTLLDIAMTSGALSIVRFANQTIYFFSQVLPAWLEWFGSHWREVFTDILHITESVATNIWKNLANLWDAIEGLFNGEGFNFKWTPLTDGFKSAISELPKIAEREMGPLEKSLQDQLDSSMTNLVSKFDDHQQKFKQSAKAGMSAFAAAVLPGAEGDKGKGGDLAGLIPDMQKKKQDVFTTFSASALLAGAGGGGDKVHKSIKDMHMGLGKKLDLIKNSIDDGGELDA